MNGLDRIVSGEVRRWLARGGTADWTAQALWDEIARFMAEAPQEERLGLLAAISGFISGLQAETTVQQETKET